MTTFTPSTTIEELSVRMEGLVQSRDVEVMHATADETLVQAMMVIASKMPSRPRTEIARLLDAYDRVPKHYA